MRITGYIVYYKKEEEKEEKEKNILYATEIKRLCSLHKINPCINYDIAIANTANHKKYTITWGKYLTKRELKKEQSYMYTGNGFFEEVIAEV